MPSIPLGQDRPRYGLERLGSNISQSFSAAPLKEPVVDTKEATITKVDDQPSEVGGMPSPFW